MGITKGPDPDNPYFRGPRRFVKIAENSEGPLYSRHNHHAAVTECPNGDLLAAWYTTVTERGREIAVGASRLRYGQDEWEIASPPREFQTTDRGTFTLSNTTAEPKGYMSGDQARNGFIHLITSANHYEFNLKWLETPTPEQQ